MTLLAAWTDADGSLWVDIPLDRLREHADPYTTPPWDDCSAFTPADVWAAVNAGRLQPVFHNPDAPGDTTFHIERIAWFVAHPELLVPDPNDVEALEIEAPIGVLGYWPRWMVAAGNHRYAAGLALGYQTLPFVVSGGIDDAEALFGIPINTPVYGEASRS